ncbi:hypothetical protein ESZ00_19400 [Silvibacterium dinghuense]|uniref:Uncharacterized protein n=1 Tax=Silvibacterium dinghuense TaxID=1560006 RepID=A0A4Q1S7M6_9BACT|nr:hypothetical protein ESZ00_19400 [Silvibacterium dinghuense]
MFPPGPAPRPPEGGPPGPPSGAPGLTAPPGPPGARLLRDWGNWNSIGRTTFAIVIVASGMVSFARFAQLASLPDC